MCVITWNVNKSSAQYDFLCDMAQCQANVVMFQETQNWQDEPHTWGGEANLEDYYKMLKDLDKNMQEVRQKYQVSGIIAGMDA